MIYIVGKEKRNLKRDKTMEKLKITVGTGKLEDVRSLNTSPLHNSFCMKMAKGNTVCAKCYSIQSLKTYRKGCDKAWSRNGDILTEKVYPADEMPFLNDAIFRIHSHGELINDIHLENIYNLARRNPQTNISIFTKRKDLVAKVKDKPENVILIYSNPVMDRVMETPPNGFHKVFNVVTKREGNNVNCGSRKCADCQICYKFKSPDCVVELEKSEQLKEKRAAKKAAREKAMEVA